MKDGNQRSLGHFVGAALCWLLAAATAPASAQERFEAAAWVDSFDFAGCRREGRLLFDTETATGNLAVLEHVLETGATTVLWRNCAGATMRYQSKEDSHHQDAPLDKRRIPDNRPIHGWLRYGEAEPDILRYILAQCKTRKLVPGVHWPFEETHWAGWTVGGWNLEHPQYWVRDAAGTPWCGRTSLAYPEVMEHKLRLVEELIDRGMTCLFIDTFRNGGWGPAWEYVPPLVERWRKRYGEPPPAQPDDPRWCSLVAEDVSEFMRRIRRRFDQTDPPLKLMLGIPDIAPVSDRSVIDRGVDWQGLVREGIIDTLVINTVRWDRKRPFESTRELYQEILATVDGRCRVLCPVRAYNYGNFGMPHYAKESGLEQHEIAEKLTRIAWEVGADGISLECVDYGNYSSATRQTLRALLAGPCKWKRVP